MFVKPAPSTSLFAAFVVVLGALLFAGSLQLAQAQNSQNSSLYGYVRDARTGETLPEANVRVRRNGAFSGTGTATNDAGLFTLTDLRPGRVTLVVSYVGYRSYSRVVDLEAGDERRVDVELAPGDILAGKVTVQGRRAEERTAGNRRLKAADLQELPSAFGNDVFRSIRLLPGVTTTSDYSGRLYIRGGSSSQTLVQLDGTTVYDPTHFFGFFSMFNPFAVRDVQLYKGTYPVDRGGRLGSLVDLRTKSGNRRETTGGVSVGLATSRAYVEGPYGTPGPGDGLGGSYMVALRRSTFEPVLAGLQNVDTRGIPDALSFYDVNAHATVNPGPDDEVSLALYGSRDFMDLTVDGIALDLAYGNQGVSADWTHLFGNRLFSTVTVTGSRYRNEPRVQDVVGRPERRRRFEETNEIADLSLRADLEYALSGNHALKGGLEASRLHHELRSTRDGTPRWQRDVSGYRAAAYLQDTFEPSPNWQLRGGLRGTYFERGSYWRLSPRLTVTYAPASSVQLRAAYSRTHQYVTLDTDPRFSGFDTWFIADEGVAPSSSRQVSVGGTVSVGDGWLVEAAGYYRRMNDLFEERRDGYQGPRGTGGIDLPAGETTIITDPVENLYAREFEVGEGRAYGGELFVKRRTGPVTGFLSYTIGRSERKFPGRPRVEPQYYPAGYDRTHELTLHARWQVTGAWALTSQLTYRTGRPYTDDRRDPILDDPFQDSGLPARLPSEINAERLPAYHRLDLGVVKTGPFFNVGRYRLSAQIVNAYAHRNVWFYRYEREDGGERVRNEIPQIPVPFPSATFTVTF
jgi:outer membrane receptor protein involved in Fe transport